MKILVVGGGSGGHVTPVVAVIHEIKKSRPKAKIRFWCDKKFAPCAKEILDSQNLDIPVQIIYAGKFRQYYHLTVIRQIFWPSVVLKNFGDLFLILTGFFQSIFKLILWRPNVVFIKGGFVCLPVGFAAKILRITTVIHDSDAHPGLTNRLLSRWASSIATGAPLEYYNYPSNKSRYVGIPISSEFHELSDDDKIQARERWRIKAGKPLLVVTGGGLGASRINDAIVSKLNDLLEICTVVLVSGEAQYEEIKSKTLSNNDNFKLISFVSDGMASLLGAADVVVTRAGATSILELAALHKTTILIPNAKLTGGHQIKNATVYQDARAVQVVNEDEMVDNPQILVDAIKDLLCSAEKSAQMAKQLATFAKPNAAADVAEMILENAK